MVTKRHFGVTRNGEDVYAYTLENDRGISVTVLDYGATLQSVVLTHKGERIDVVLGYDTIGEYENNDGYLGASIGRFAGRIPDSQLRIGDDVCPVTTNEGKNQLHGGACGFDKRVWQFAPSQIPFERENSVRFRLHSVHGEEGYPCGADFDVTYLLNCRSLCIRFHGRYDHSDGSHLETVTAWNPTNHAYWNLNGHDAGSVLNHRLEIPADRYVPVGPDMIPTGGEADVTGTRFDFRSMRAIESAYDHSFVLSGDPIRLWGNRGIGMEIETDCKAVQLYTAEHLSERKGKGGAAYRPFGAVCLEAEGRQTMRGSSIAEENVLLKRSALNEREILFKFYTEE